MAFVQVVGVEIGRNLSRRCEAHGEYAPEIAVVGAITGLGVHVDAHHVLAFQLHVHHIAAVADVCAGNLAAEAGLVIDFHVLNHVRTDVFEHQLFVAVKKSLPFRISDSTVRPFTLITPLSSSVTPGSCSISASSIEPSAS